MFQKEVEGRDQAMAAEAAAVADHLLDLEAAEQLIQLSGGDGAADDGVSETRSADSIKYGGADHRQAGMKEKEKEVAVESRRRTKSDAERSMAGKEPPAVEIPRKRVAGDGEERRRRVVADGEEWRAGGMKEKEKEKEVAVESRRAKNSAERFVPGKELAVESSRRRRVVDVGEERRKTPRFRWLADIYRETRQIAAQDQRAAGGPDPRLEADDMRKKKRKRAVGADEEDLVVVVPKAVPKEINKERTMVA